MYYREPSRLRCLGSKGGAVLQISSPLAVIGGHSKAVSYVRWVGSNQVISASTDNHLKLWDVAEAAISEGNCAPVTSFTGEGCLSVSKFLAGPAS